MKRVIEAAKKFAKAIIDMARKAIVKFIKIFGEILKKLVSIVLFAFPELAKKFNALIDKAVNLAVAAVNKLADLLKKAVSLLLDALGTALDMILAAYQKLYNMLISALEFIAVGLLKILEGVANLAKAAKQSPEHFFGQMSEELLGQDVTQPLENEAPMPDTNAKALEQAVASGAMEKADAELMRKERYQEHDVEVDQVLTNAELDPALMQTMATMPEGEHEFGGQADQEHGMAAVKEDILSAPEAEEPVKQEVEQVAAQPGQIGPFATPMERAAYLAGQVRDAVVTWWQENKVKIIVGIVAGIVGLILANLLTGGAIMAALPALMQIVGIYFAIDGIISLAGHFASYLTTAYPGNIGQGAKHLARGLAALAIELIFALLFSGKAMLKSMKKTVKTVGKKGVKGAVKSGVKSARRSVKKGAKETLESAKTVGRSFKQGGQAVVKNGKMMVQGVRKGFAKGAKTLGDLGKKLSQKLRFKKFRISIKNRKWQLEGEVNPWVLLASGEVAYEGNIKTEISNNRSRSKKFATLINEGNFTKEQKEQLVNYLNLNPGTKKSPESILKELELKKISEKGTLYTDYNGLTRKYAKLVDGKDVKMPFSELPVEIQSILSDLAKKRKELLDQANALRNSVNFDLDSDVYKSLMQKAREISNEIGVIGSDAMVKRMYAQSDKMKSIYGGPGAKSRAGDFDQVVAVQSGDQVKGIVIESKGGSSDLGFAITRNPDYYAQQGTTEYFNRTKETMKQIGGDAENAVKFLDQVARAQNIGKGQIDYVWIQTQIDDLGNITGMLLKQFDIE